MIYCGEIYRIWYLKVGDKEGKHLIDLDLIQVFSRSLMTVFVGGERTAGAVFGRGPTEQRSCAEGTVVSARSPTSLTAPGIPLSCCKLF